MSDGLWVVVIAVGIVCIFAFLGLIKALGNHDPFRPKDRDLRKAYDYLIRNGQRALRLEKLCARMPNMLKAHKNCSSLRAFRNFEPERFLFSELSGKSDVRDCWNSFFSLRDTFYDSVFKIVPEEDSADAQACLDFVGTEKFSFKAYDQVRVLIDKRMMDRFLKRSPSHQVVTWSYISPKGRNRYYDSVHVSVRDIEARLSVKGRTLSGTDLAGAEPIGVRQRGLFDSVQTPDKAGGEFKDDPSLLRVFQTPQDSACTVSEKVSYSGRRVCQKSSSGVSGLGTGNAAEDCCVAVKRYLKTNGRRYARLLAIVRETEAARRPVRISVKTEERYKAFDPLKWAKAHDDVFLDAAGFEERFYASLQRVLPDEDETDFRSCCSLFSFGDFKFREYCEVRRGLDMELEAMFRNAYNQNIVICWQLVSPSGNVIHKDSRVFQMGDIVRNLISAAPEPEPEVNKWGIPKAWIKKERGKLTSKLRYTILKRDNHHCVICGRGAEDGVKLHVDHIKPVSRGGLTVPENLRTLCQDCNLGKKDQWDPNGVN